MRGVFKRTYNRQKIIVVVVVADKSGEKSGEKYWFNPPTLFIYSIFFI
jgi:hypothetical protein